VTTVDRVRAKLIEVGAVAEVEERIASLTGTALARLRATPVAGPAGDRLAELAVSATKRAS
jgi:geranylgeranyl diphosphate synthase type I